MVRKDRIYGNLKATAIKGRREFSQVDFKVRALNCSV